MTPPAELRLTPCLPLLLWAQRVEPPVLFQPGRDAARQTERSFSDRAGRIVISLLEIMPPAGLRLAPCLPLLLWAQRVEPPVLFQPGRDVARQRERSFSDRAGRIVISLLEITPPAGLRLAPCLPLLLWAQRVEPPVLFQPGRNAARQRERSFSERAGRIVISLLEISPPAGLRLAPCLPLLLWAQWVEPPVLLQPGRDATRQKEKARSESGPFLFESDGTSGRTRTGTPVKARDFESLMSTNFITLAH